MRPLFLSLVLITLFSCNRQYPEAMVPYLDGYWEIERVTMPDGSVKEFGMSGTVDYIVVQGDSGVRKKVVPRLDGSFLVNDAAEQFTLKLESDSLHLHYSTPFDQWKESVLQAGDDQLEVLNRDGKRYRYKRYSGFTADK